MKAGTMQPKNCCVEIGFTEFLTQRATNARTVLCDRYNSTEPFTPELSNRLRVQDGDCPESECYIEIFQKRPSTVIEAHNRTRPQSAEVLEIELIFLRRPLALPFNPRCGNTVVPKSGSYALSY